MPSATKKTRSPRQLRSAAGSALPFCLPTLNDRNSTLNQRGARFDSVSLRSRMLVLGRRNQSWRRALATVTSEACKTCASGLIFDLQTSASLRRSQRLEPCRSLAIQPRSCWLSMMCSQPGRARNASEPQGRSHSLTRLQASRSRWLQRCLTSWRHQHGSGSAGSGSFLASTSPITR